MFSSNGKTYRVTAIGANAFSCDTTILDITIPATVTTIGENAFYPETVLYVYENSAAWEQLSEKGYILNTLTPVTLSGDVNADGALTVADAVMLQKWLLHDGMLTDWQAADFYQDAILNGLDLCLMKQKLLTQ